MADEPRTVTVDLHPMHLQVAAHLKFLEGAEPGGDDKRERERERLILNRAIEVLRNFDRELTAIECRHMGIMVAFKP